MGVILALLGFLVAVLSSAVAAELHAWSPWLVDRLIRCAVARLPESLRERYEEEWRSHVEAVPGDISRLLLASGLVIAGFRMSTRARVLGNGVSGPLDTLLLSFQFHRYRDHLLTSSAALWFLSTRLLVVLMACTEALAWGYLGFIFGPGPHRWLTAVLTGIPMFVVVWMIDLSLVTVDRAREEHCQTILGYRSSGRWRNLFMFACRVLLIAGSLTITAPYIAQIVFRSDIRAYVENKAQITITAFRTNLSAKYDRAFADKKQELQTQHDRYQMEVAGRGASRHRGVGPTARTIAKNIATLETDLATVTAEKHAVLARFDALAHDWKANQQSIENEYQLPPTQPIILQNREALNALRARPEFRSTELAIKAFLAFVFAGLLLVKIYEPTSVRLYLSEVLQQEYTRYLAGELDEALPEWERSTASGRKMSPHRLYAVLQQRRRQADAAPPPDR